jgi:hypothetical protein
MDLFINKNTIKPFDERRNSDKFELIIKIQRFFGLSYYGFYKLEKNILYIFLFVYQIAIFGKTSVQHGITFVEHLFSMSFE